MIDYLEKLGESTNLQQVWELHCEAMKARGFDRMIYGFTRFATQRGAGELEDALFLSSHDDEYFDRYIGEKMFLNAPVTHWALDNVGAMSWGKLWTAPENLTPEELEVIAYNRAMGVTAGYTISFPAPSPRSAGLIAMAGRPGLSQDELDETWAVHGREIMIMNNMAHLKITSLPQVTQRPKLSKRQREVLEWIGEGKSNQDVATIMGVSVPTVEKHLRLAREKLGVDTTAQAILKASFQNQIYLL
ncbi:MAG: helix-turn-helix transcriptional regulator [Maritimibacter sp.]